MNDTTHTRHQQGCPRYGWAPNPVLDQLCNCTPTTVCTDETLPNGCTLRRWVDDNGTVTRWDVYNPSGIRHGGNYKTEAGALRGADDAAAQWAGAK